MNSGVSVVGVADKGRERIRAEAFFGLADEGPMQRDANDVHRLAVAYQRVDPLGDHGLGFHRAAFRPDLHPMAGFDAFFLGELLGNFDEEFRLHHRVEADVFGPEVEVLGQPIGGRRVGKLLGVAELLQIVLEYARHRIAADFRRDDIDDRRFKRLVVGRKRPIAQQARA